MANDSSESIYTRRQALLNGLLESSGLRILALNTSPSLIYLTGLHFHLMERPVVALFSSGQEPGLVLPELELGKTRGRSFPLRTFPYGDNPDSWSSAFLKAAQAMQIDEKEVGIDPRALRVLELRFLESAAPRARFVSAETCLAALRLQKDESEISFMKKAVVIAQEALTDALKAFRLHMTERELASELVLQLIRHGSDSEMAFAPIVATGPNSANPHSLPTDRQIDMGDILVIDWGAVYQGYVSDLTRTFVIGDDNPEFRRIAEIVAQANAAGREAARPDIPAGDVDRAARVVIDRSGYGPYFIHRTGHGIGMEGHEGPYIYSENTQLLRPGMTFTVEPGIYLPEKGGVRIEDNVAITHNGSQTLSSLPRDLVILAP